MGGRLRSRSEQHRQHPEQHVVADDDFGREILQHLLHALVLSGNGIDEYPLHGNAEPFQPRRNGFQFRSHRREVAQIEIRAGRKGVKPCADAFDRAAQGAAGQKGDLVAFVDQEASDRKQRIEMAGGRGRSE